MSVSEVGLRGHDHELDIGGGSAAERRLFSVAELQVAFRGLLSQQKSGPHPAQPGADLAERWVCVVAAHAGAGASTIALAIADAAATQSAAQLIEIAHPHRSGLMAASVAELGLDPSGQWRQGSRGQVRIDRRASDAQPTGWPPGMTTDDGLVVVDLGLAVPGDLARLNASHCAVVVVCRATVPGVRAAEQLLTRLRRRPVVLAVLGPGRWPGEVDVSLGSLLRDLRVAKAVVTVPLDRRLSVIGLTAAPLPKPVVAAGLALVTLLDAHRDDGCGDSADVPNADQDTDKPGQATTPSYVQKGIHR